MTDTVWKIWCEWDVGQEGRVFISEDVAREWARQNPYLGEADTGMTFDEILDEGLLSFEEWGVIY